MVYNRVLAVISRHDCSGVSRKTEVVEKRIKSVDLRCMSFSQSCVNWYLAGASLLCVLKTSFETSFSADSKREVDFDLLDGSGYLSIQSIVS